MVVADDLGDHAAHRRPDDVRRVDVEGVEQADRVGGHVTEGVGGPSGAEEHRGAARDRRLDVSRAADVAVVESDHPVAALAEQVAERPVPEDHLGAEAHHEEERLARRGRRAPRSRARPRRRSRCARPPPVRPRPPSIRPQAAAIASAVRRASAMIVIIGLAPEAVGKALASPIHTPVVSWSSPHGVGDAGGRVGAHPAAAHLVGGEDARTRAAPAGSPAASRGRRRGRRRGPRSGPCARGRDPLGARGLVESDQPPRPRRKFAMSRSSVRR